MQSVTIVGGGLVGALLSVLLAKKNYEVNIFERRPDLRGLDGAGGRSINLALSDRGWRALEKAGIAEDIRKIAIPMHGRMLHQVNGELAMQPYGVNGEYINSVSRTKLNSVLLDIADKNNHVKLHFDQRCVGMDFNNSLIEFEHTVSGHRYYHYSEMVFGSDGAFSAVRLQMQLSIDRFNYQQYYIPHGYKELTIPPAKGGGWRMEKNALHIWPRGQFMLIALPNEDGSFTCTLFLPFEGEESFSNLVDDDKVMIFFQKYFPDAVDLMPSLLQDFSNNPTSSLVTVKCFPWTVKNNVCLIGDAAHAIVPFFGQGMNCGFEDCTVLDNLLESENDLRNVLQDFQNLRKLNADAIADLAIGNFVEMRDKVADPKFLLQKKIESNFSRKHPGRWVPLYSLVTFSPDVPYAVALEEGEKHEQIMQQVMNIPGIETKWDSAEVEELMLKLTSN